MRNMGDSIGFVPTMGALHDGHMTLIEKAKEHASCTVVSIFVNPTQFAPHEDFDSYPREASEDAKKLAEAGVDILFLPNEDVLYPDGYATDIKAGSPSLGLETDFRPHFFDGVVNVVSRLFDAVKPDVAIFGEKDFQQLQVIRDMVETHNMGINVIGAPIARDEHGLALSSRNAYLSDDELQVARQLNQVLHNLTTTQDFENAHKALTEIGFDKIDYIEKRWDRILAAVWLGKTRLIDNISTL